MEAQKSIKNWLQERILQSEQQEHNIQLSAIARINARRDADNFRETLEKLEEYELQETNQTIESWGKNFDKVWGNVTNDTPTEYGRKITVGSKTIGIGSVTSNTPAEYMHLTEQEQREMEIVSQNKISK